MPFSTGPRECSLFTGLVTAERGNVAYKPTLWPPRPLVLLQVLSHVANRIRAEGSCAVTRGIVWIPGKSS
jgi:hypothetical protein